MDRILHPRQDGRSSGLTVSKTASGDFSRQVLPDEAAKQLMLKWLAGGLAVGAGARGAVGLWNVLRRNLGGEQDVPDSRPAALPVLPRPTSKQAQAPAVPTPDPWQSPIAWAGVPAMALGGAWGSYKLMDYLLDSVRRSRLKSEVEDAKREFVSTIRGQMPGAKMASADGDALDRLYDGMQKQAFVDSLGKTLDYLKGSYLLYALASAGLAGGATYAATRRGSQAKATNEALKRIQARRQLEAPQRVTLVPEEEDV